MVAGMASPGPEACKRVEEVTNAISVRAITIRAATLRANHSCWPFLAANLGAAYSKR